MGMFIACVLDVDLQRSSINVCVYVCFYIYIYIQYVMLGAIRLLLLCWCE